MEQDEIYQRAMDAAGNRIKNGESGVDKDGRPLANAARNQRHAIQTEQVHFATHLRYNAPFGPSRIIVNRCTLPFVSCLYFQVYS